MHSPTPRGLKPLGALSCLDRARLGLGWARSGHFLPFILWEEKTLPLKRREITAQNRIARLIERSALRRSQRGGSAGVRSSHAEAGAEAQGKPRGAALSLDQTSEGSRGPTPEGLSVP